MSVHLSKRKQEADLGSPKPAGLPTEVPKFEVAIKVLSIKQPQVKAYLCD